MSGVSHHGMGECFLDQVDTALVDRLTVWQEATLKGSGHRGETLKEEFM